MDKQQWKRGLEMNRKVVQNKSKKSLRIGWKEKENYDPT